VLLDECVDRRLAGDTVGHDVKTSPDVGWAGLTNGDLLTLAQREFDAFITVDRRLPFQQNLSRFRIAVIVLRAPSTRLGRSPAVDSRTASGGVAGCQARRGDMGRRRARR